MNTTFSSSSSFLKIAFESAIAAVVVTDEKFRITYLNPAACDLMGSFELKSIGKSLFTEIKLSPENKAIRTKAIIETQLAKNTKGPIRLQFHVSNEISEPVEMEITEVVEAKKQVTGYLLRFKRISKEFLLTQSVRESERKYKGLFDNAVEGIFILDDSGAILDFNPSACRIYGIKDFTGLNIFSLFPQNSPADSKKFWKGFMSNGIISGFYRYNLPNKKIAYIDFKAKANYLPNTHLAVFNDVTDKRLTEKALLSSEANLKAIFDSSEQSIILIDLEGKILAANIKAGASSKSVLGKTLLIGENILQYIVNKELFVTECAQAKKGNKITVERNIIGTKGEDNWFEFSYVPIRDTKGKVVSICYTSTSINKRKRQAIVLEESEQKFRSLSENSPDIIYIIDIEKRVISYFNRDIVFGYSSSSLVTSEAWIEIVHPGDYKRVVDHWQKFLKSKSKKTGSIDYRVRRIGGDYEWVSNRHIVIEWTPKGLPAKVLLNITIVTEQRKAQEALKESEARLKALIENTNDLVWSIDNEFSLTAFNSSFADLIKSNYKKSIKVGDNLYSVLPGLNQDGWLALHISALKGKRVTAEFSWQSKKKENLFYEISYNPIYDSFNNVCGVSVFARDITQRKTNEATIVQTNFELDSFVYRASHDLRAPLRSILGLVNIINTQADEDDKVNYLRLIEKSAIKLDNFISDLINFSRNSRASVDIEEVDFEVVIGECRENILFMDSADQVAFSYKVKQTAPFYSDTKRISIFMNNFLSNAIKYQDPSKKKKSFVNILVNTNATHTIITIEDNGVGIKKEYQSKIFNMFFRASENSFGSGLGLYIARQAIERLGGEVKVDSKLGIGTTFTIKLPNLESKMFDFSVL